MRYDLKLAYAIVLVVIICMQVIGLTGLIPTPLEQLGTRLYGATAVGNFGFFLVHFIILQLFSRPSPRELAWVLAAGAASLPFMYGFAIPEPWDRRPLLYWVVTGLPGFGLASLAALGLRLRDPLRDADATRALLAACGLVPLAVAAALCSLRLSAALHPATLDLYLYRFDATLGFETSATLGMVLRALPPLEMAAAFAYHLLPYTISAVFAFQVGRRLDTPASIVLVQWLGGLTAWALYHVFPATGPLYVFGDLFPYFLPADVPVAPVNVLPAPRNAMPSMHYGWALALWLSAVWTRHRGLRATTAVLLGLTVLATLGLGEHYLIDLVVATPCVVALQAACTRTLAWDDPSRRRAFVWGAALTLAWLALLRFGLDIFIAVPGLSWVAVLATMAASVAVYLPLHRAAQISFMPARPARRWLTSPLAGTVGLRIAGLFVLSGFAGLVYQVLFSKSLALTFGSTSTATYTVLATYMGGMALGAWAGGAIGARRSDPLVLYALCELGVGLYCLATPWLLPSIRDLYVTLASDIPADSALLVAARFGLGSAGLLVPTILMGMTLPVLARYFEQRREALGTSVAWLYAANTTGAALGALLAGYAILPALGMTRATLVAVATNLFAAYFALRLAKTAAAQLDPSGAARAQSVAPAASAEPDRRLARAALAILCFGGIVTLALEVDYFHLLAVVAGNSVYAFALMLFAFLIGLGAGAEVARRLLMRAWPLAWMLAWLEFGLASAILLGIPLWDGLPRYFGSFAGYPLEGGFAARELIRGGVCALAMIPPALFIGAAYPVAMEAVARAARGTPIAALGRAAALNTAGNIIGVIVGGFVLLPGIGALLSLKILAAICFTLGVGALAAARQVRPTWSWVGAAVVMALLVSTPWTFDYTALASGANVYFAPQGYGKVIDHAESVDGGLTTVAEGHLQGTRTLTLLTNGKFQGNDSLGGEMKAQAGVSLAPLLHLGAREHALVIGYGTGVSARILHDAGFRRMDLVDLSADIISLANRHFAGLNGHVSGRPGVRTHVTDGRNFLMLQRLRYDLVAMEISSIWFAGAASLYNHEFYELVHERLAPHGVLQQWVQLHHIRPLDLLYVLGSVRSVFRHVWLYYIGNQGIIVASNDVAAAQTAANVALLDRTPVLAPHLALYGGSAEELLKTRLLDPAGVDRLLAASGVPGEQLVSTDDNLILEYGTPKGNVLDGPSSLQANLAFLRSFASPRPATER